MTPAVWTHSEHNASILVAVPAARIAGWPFIEVRVFLDTVNSSTAFSFPLGRSEQVNTRLFVVRHDVAGGGNMIFTPSSQQMCHLTQTEPKVKKDVRS